MHVPDVVVLIFILKWVSTVIIVIRWTKPHHRMDNVRVREFTRETASDCSTVNCQFFSFLRFWSYFLMILMSISVFAFQACGRHKMCAASKWYFIDKLRAACSKYISYKCHNCVFHVQYLGIFVRNSKQIRKEMVHKHAKWQTTRWKQRNSTRNSHIKQLHRFGLDMMLKNSLTKKKFKSKTSILNAVGHVNGNPCDPVYFLFTLQRKKEKNINKYICKYWFHEILKLTTNF